MNETNANANAVEPANELMLWTEIRKVYPDQWVALIDMDWDDETDEFTVARVVAVDATRRGLFDQLRVAGVHYEVLARFYTGRLVAP